MRTESNKHKEAREYIARLYGGINKDSFKRSINSYFPDVATDIADYEIELLSKGTHIKGKIKRWKNGKKKVLIVCVDDEIIKLFDEVYFYQGGKLR